MELTTPSLIVSQGKEKFLLTKLPARVIARISYVAIRGQSDERGAIQRVLNPRRIASIKEFTLAGGAYPNAIILNWASKTNRLRRKGHTITLSDDPNSAQIIDGQHRVAGLRAAIESSEEVGAIELPVVIYEGLTTQACADIFLSINTEQKPVPRSLVFDLYGEASEHIVDPAAVRARDIAMFLNESEESPYYSEVKLPGAPTRKGGIALSTVIAAIKPLVEDKGIFEQIEVKELEMQRQIILNLFTVISQKYGDSWKEKDNVFMWAAGFMGAMDFLKLKLIPYCNTKSSFTMQTISDALRLDQNNLITQNEVKGLGGKDAPKRVYEKLVDSFKAKASAGGKFEI